MKKEINLVLKKSHEKEINLCKKIHDMKHKWILCFKKNHMEKIYLVLKNHVENELITCKNKSCDKEMN